MDSNSGFQPSYWGFLETAGDAQRLADGCLRGSLPVVRRRPTTSEQPSLVQSGHIFVFEETTSGIKRWTDGKRWTPSRVLDAFLVYGELNPAGRQPRTAQTDVQTVVNDEGMKGRQDQLYGPLAKSFNIRPEDLVKKTIRFPYLERTWHVVSYYRPVDVLQNGLKRPFMDQDNQGHCANVALRREFMPHLYLSLNHQAEENRTPSMWPLDIRTPTLMDVEQFYHKSNELDHDHCNAQQDSLPSPGVWDLEVMPDSTMASETRQQGLNLESSWLVVTRDSES